MIKEKTTKIFSRDGILSKEFATFEYREEQEKMSRVVNKAIKGKKHALVEAGTGTGKTWAYLFPALNSGKTIVVSTETKNLQDQIAKKDLPLIVDIIKKYSERDVKFGIAIGKGNYICRRKINRFKGKLENGEISFEYEEEFKKIRDFVDNTETGKYSDLDWTVSVFIKEKTCCSSDDCLKKKCAFVKCSHKTSSNQCSLNDKFCDNNKDCEQYEPLCFHEKQKVNLSKCNLIISNHALYMRDVFADGYNLLPRHDAVILDEAHHLYECAVKALTIEVSNYKIRDLVSDIRTTHVYKKHNIPDNMFLYDVVNESDAFFDQFKEQFKEQLDKYNKSEYELTEYKKDLLDKFIEKLDALYGFLLNCLSYTVGDDSVEVKGYIDRVEDFIADLKAVTSTDDNSTEYVNWVACKKQQNGKVTVRLNAALVDVSELLKTYLFNKKTVVLSSATLSVEGKFDFVAQQLGVGNDYFQAIIGSPFDYRENCCLYLGNADIYNEKACLENLVGVIKKSVEMSNGRAFCLFTSYRMLNKAYEELKDIGFPIFKQGSVPRGTLFSNFMTTDNSVIFGTASFGEGVSVEGEKLSLVVIDKIPFPVFTEPIMRARIRIAKEKYGKEWFEKFYLPIAILKLKQWCGRLIRTKKDRGLLIINDGRIVSSRYGNRIIKALPPAKIISDLGDAKSVLTVEKQINIINDSEDKKE